MMCTPAVFQADPHQLCQTPPPCTDLPHHSLHACRDRPVPIPAPGVQLVSLSHVEDVASMLASVIGKKHAIGQHYNICSDRSISLVVRGLSQPVAP
jgi:nucleoside-diphosphate-sugar epimerase